MKRSGLKKEGTVNVSSLKAHLSKYLRMARFGEPVVVMDHKMPVARIVPYESGDRLESVKATAEFSSLARLRVPPRTKKAKADSLALLLEERGNR